MPTTAKNTGSHCVGQAPRRAEECDPEPGRPTAREGGGGDGEGGGGEGDGGEGGGEGGGGEGLGGGGAG